MNAFRRPAPLALALAIAAVIVAVAWLWMAHGSYGLGVLMRRGGSYWVSMTRDDPRLSPAMRLALRDLPPVAEAGPFEWHDAEPGFELAETPVLAEGRQVDGIMLARVDPHRFRFVARNAPAGDKDIDQWAQSLPGALLIVNGSYYDGKGLPDTPIISEGVAAGPANYDARGGALVDDGETARLIDLAGKEWRTELAGAKNAMVSYPMLIGADGGTRTGSDSRWLANRTFLGWDRSGRIVIGTTREAFFSLARLAIFLKTAPLDLRLVLNLDGGPIACRSLNLTGVRQTFYAQWESQFQENKVSLLRSLVQSAPWAMPMVLSIERR